MIGGFEMTDIVAVTTTNATTQQYEP